MKKRKVALFDPYLDVLGGGEKHVLSILKALENEYEIHIFWGKNLQNEFKKQFSLTFSQKIVFHPKGFDPKTSTLTRTLLLSEFDAFLYVTDGSYFFSPAKKNFIFCMVPEKKRYLMTLANRIKTANAQFITNSHFTGDYLQKFGIKNEVLYPYIDDSFFKKNKTKKEDVILSVGRYFRHLHKKNFEVVIEAYKKLKKENPKFKDTQLVFAGGLKKEEEPYLHEVRRLAADDPSIKILTNVPFPKLLDLYAKAKYYWHFTGYGIDEDAEPEKTEHLGITPLEAMAAGCITFCFNAGGPRELITSGKNGFLFSSVDELIQQISDLSNNSTKEETIRANTRKYMKETFTYEVFKKNVHQTLQV